jgi:tRNA (guanine10-N2)-methyltransferase
MKFLFVFAQAHSDFRIPELLSVAELYGFEPVFPETVDQSRPFMVVDLQAAEHATLLARRCILIKFVPFKLCTWLILISFARLRAVYELYGEGPSYEALHSENRANRHLWAQYINTCFKFSVTAFNHKIPQSRQTEIMESFAYMEFLGKIDVKNPEIILSCFEECAHPTLSSFSSSCADPHTNEDPDRRGLIRERHEGDGKFRHVYFGRLVGSMTCALPDHWIANHALDRGGFWPRSSGSF